MLVSNWVCAGTELPAQTIKRLATGWGSEGIYILTNENLLAEGCSSSVARLVPSHPLKSEIMSILLSAFHSKSKVNLYVNGCVDDNMKLEAVAISD